jgi:hypothetical protein
VLSAILDARKSDFSGKRVAVSIEIARNAECSSLRLLIPVSDCDNGQVLITPAPSWMAPATR